MITEPQPQRCPSCGQQGCRADLCDQSAAHAIVVMHNRWHDTVQREVERYKAALSDDGLADLNAAVLLSADDKVAAMREMMVTEFRHGVARGMLNGQ